MFNLSPAKYNLIDHENGKLIGVVESYGIIPAERAFITMPDNTVYEVQWVEHVLGKDKFGLMTVQINVGAKKQSVTP